MSSPRVESSRNTSSFLIWGPDGKSAPVFPYSVVSPLSLACWSDSWTDTALCSTELSLWIIHRPPIPYWSERSLDISPSQRPPTGRVLCSDDLTASRYWLLCALLTPIMMPQEYTGTKDQKNQFCEIVCVSWSKRRVKCQTKTWSNTLFNLYIDSISGYIFEFYCLSWVFSFRVQSYFFIMQIIPAPINNADVTF